MSAATQYHPRCWHCLRLFEQDDAFANYHTVNRDVVTIHDECSAAAVIVLRRIAPNRMRVEQCSN